MYLTQMVFWDGKKMINEVSVSDDSMDEKNT